MKFLYDDESFSFEALRAAGYSDYGGADLGEVLVTCRQIPEGDEDAWSAQWAATVSGTSTSPSPHSPAAPLRCPAAWRR